MPLTCESQLRICRGNRFSLSLPENENFSWLVFSTLTIENVMLKVEKNKMDNPSWLQFWIKITFSSRASWSIQKADTPEFLNMTTLFLELQGLKARKLIITRKQRCHQEVFMTQLKRITSYKVMLSSSVWIFLSPASTASSTSLVSSETPFILTIWKRKT